MATQKKDRHEAFHGNNQKGETCEIHTSNMQK